MSGDTMTSQANQSAATNAQIQERGKLAAAASAILFGTFLVWGAAFASPATIHNAAHDARHAMGFPCH